MYLLKRYDFATHSNTIRGVRLNPSESRVFAQIKEGFEYGANPLVTLAVAVDNENAVQRAYADRGQGPAQVYRPTFPFMQWLQHGPDPKHWFGCLCRCHTMKASEDHLRAERCCASAGKQLDRRERFELAYFHAQSKLPVRPPEPYRILIGLEGSMGYDQRKSHNLNGSQTALRRELMILDGYTQDSSGRWRRHNGTFEGWEEVLVEPLGGVS